MAKRTSVAVWMDKYKRWQIKVQKDNIRRSFYSSEEGKKGQRECHAKADAWLDDNISHANTKFCDMFDKWIEELKITTSKSHWGQYEGFEKNQIKPLIGGVKLGKITEQHLQDVINSAYKHGLSKKTLINIRACLTAFIKYCRKSKATTLFPESLVIPRNAYTKEKSILQPDDLKILFSSDKTILRGKEYIEIFINAYRFAAVTGLRPGEIKGLEKNDIKNDIIYLRRSINKYGEETTGKNDNARRNFQLTQHAQQILNDQENLMESLEIKSKYIFPNEHGEAITQSRFYKRWVKYRDYNNFSSKISPYELRHTFVSMVKSLPTGLLKSIVGHSKDMDTYGIYSHEVNGDMTITANKIDGIFTKILDNIDNSDT